MRTPVTVKIKFKSPSLEDFIERYAVDVSKAGIFIRTPKPLSVGTALNFEFQLQDGSPLLSGSGTVVWVRDQNDKQGASPGMGVRFDEIPPASRDVLTRVLEQKTEADQFGGDGAAAAAPPLAEQAPPQPEAAPEPELPEPKAPVIREPEVEEPPAPRAKAAEPPEPREKPAKPKPAAEPKRKESLGEVLFEEEDSKDAIDDGARPLAPEPARRATPTPQPAVTSAAKPVTATEERKSSPLGWVIIVLLVLGAGGWYWWKYYGPGKQEVTSPPAAVDVGVVAKPDVAPAPPPKPKVALQVESTPTGAKVLVDGQDTGKLTPATLADLDPDAEVEIALDLAGKKVHRTKLKPTAETPLKVELSEEAARKIRITSEPPGATVFLDGDKLGTTPFDVTKALKPTRAYRVKLTLDGYAAFESTVKPAELTWARDGDDELGTIAATLEQKAEPAATKRKRARPRTRKPAADDTGEADQEPAADPEPAKPEPAPAPEPTKDAPATPPATKGAIKKPSWSN